MSSTNIISKTKLARYGYLVWWTIKCSDSASRHLLLLWHLTVLTSPSSHSHLTHPLVILSLPRSGHRPLHWTIMNQGGSKSSISQLWPSSHCESFILKTLYSNILIWPDHCVRTWGPTEKYLPGLDWKIFLSLNNLYLCAVIHILAGMNHSPSCPSHPVFSCCKASLCRRECSENIKH